MLKITVLCVGKVKEKYWRDAISEYFKRLHAYCRPEIAEVADEKTPDQASDAVKAQIKAKEAERLRRRLPSDAYVIALAIEGKKMDSVGFADYIDRLAVAGKSHLVFVIGGSLGLDADFLRSADARISFSDMTFPHQMMRVILLEQIYRGFRITEGSPYHK